MDVNKTWNSANSRIRILAEKLGLKDLASELSDKAPDTYTKKLKSKN